MLPTTPRKDPAARLVVIAEDQPQYLPLPANVTPDGRVTTEWALSDEERAIVAAGGRVRLTLLTFGQPLQPILIDVLPAPAAAEEQTN
jgi:hypothetical protein